MMRTYNIDILADLLGTTPNIVHSYYSGMSLEKIKEDLKELIFYKTEKEINVLADAIFHIVNLGHYTYKYDVDELE